MADDSLNISEVAGDILCEFLEVAFHNILFVRQLYPLGTFQRKKKYNVPVQVCMHAEVNEYIQQLLHSLKEYVKCGDVDRVIFVILDEGAARPLERFVFEIAPPSKALSADTYLLRLEQSLRAFLLKLGVCDAVLSKIPADCCWRVHVSLKESDVLTIQEKQLIQDFSWVTADDKETQMSDVKIVPLKSVDSAVLQMQLYVEESGEKR